MIKLLPVCSSKIAWILLIIMFSGCSSDEEEMKEVEASAPEETSSQRYDQPDEATGFSPDQPFGHCMVFAGYDSDANQIFFSDPADNLSTGHLDRAVFTGHEIQMINGYCTTIVAGQPATLTGAVVVKPPNREVGRFPARWTQFGMPDFSQHAVGDWLCYCAPTSAANLIYFFSESFSEFSTRRIFSSDPDYQSDKNWLINRLIGGSRPPFPKEGSMAYRMETDFAGGSSLLGMFEGMKSFIYDNANNPKQWEVELITEDETKPDGEKLLDQLKRSCAAGDGVLLTIIWGVPIPSGSGSNEDGEESSESSDTGTTNKENANEGNEGSDALEAASNESQQNSEGGGVNIPGGNAKDPSDLSSTSNSQVLDSDKKYPEATHEVKKPKEVLDVDAVIVDDFDLEERSDGLWYKKNLNKPFTGKARRSYPSGKILMEIPYVQGIRQGLQKIWKEDGTLLRQVVWENGKVSRDR